MRILIIDDSALWIKHGKTLLEQSGHEVTGVLVSNPQDFTSESLPETVADAIKNVDAILVDKDFGSTVTSTRLICVLRHNIPKLPIVRWTGGYDDKPYIKYLGVTSIEKPTRENEEDFVETFNKAVDEQKIILSGAMGIFAILDETTKPDEYATERKRQQLIQIEEIAQLSNVDSVGYGKSTWTIIGCSSGITKHELGHCICDGNLTAEDIQPYLPALQKVIAKFEARDNIDDRFKICAEFIKVGNLNELELVRYCY